MISTTWTAKQLGEICNIAIGKTPSRGSKVLWDTKLQTDNTWLSIADLNLAKNKIVDTSTERISDKALPLMTLVSKGTLLLSFKLTIGRLAFAGKDLYTNEAIAQLPIKDSVQIDKYYLYYYLSAFDYETLLKGDIKVKGKSLNKQKLKVLPVYYPSLSEQQQIVEKLDTLFADIEKEKQIVQQNLQNAKELFESESNTLLTSNTDNWTEKSLNDVCKTISAGGDKPLVCSDYETELCKVPIYSNGVANNGLYGYTDKPTVFEPAITVSARGTIGFVCKREQPFCPIVRLITLVPKEDIDLSFFAYVLKLVVPQNTGSSIPQLTVPNLKPQKIKYPDLATQKVIAQKLDTLREQTQELEQIYTQQIANLDELKQAILKKAFNGEI